MESMGLSLRVIAPRGFPKVGGGDLSLPFFVRDFFVVEILKSFNKKYSIAQYCAIDLLDL